MLLSLGKLPKNWRRTRLPSKSSNYIREKISRKDTEKTGKVELGHSPRFWWRSISFVKKIDNWNEERLGQYLASSRSLRGERRWVFGECLRGPSLWRCSCEHSGTPVNILYLHIAPQSARKLYRLRRNTKLISIFLSWMRSMTASSAT